MQTSNPNAQSSKLKAFSVWDLRVGGGMRLVAIVLVEGELRGDAEAVVKLLVQAEENVHGHVSVKHVAVLQVHLRAGARRVTDCSRLLRNIASEIGRQIKGALGSDRKKTRAGEDMMGGRLVERTLTRKAAMVSASSPSSISPSLSFLRLALLGKHLGSHDQGSVFQASCSRLRLGVSGLS